MPKLTHRSGSTCVHLPFRGTEGEMGPSSGDGRDFHLRWYPHGYPGGYFHLFFALFHLQSMGVTPDPHLSISSLRQALASTTGHIHPFPCIPRACNWTPLILPSTVTKLSARPCTPCEARHALATEPAFLHRSKGTEPGSISWWNPFKTGAFPFKGSVYDTPDRCPRPGFKRGSRRRGRQARWALRSTLPCNWPSAASCWGFCATEEPWCAWNEDADENVEETRTVRSDQDARLTVWHLRERQVQARKNQERAWQVWIRANGRMENLHFEFIPSVVAKMWLTRDLWGGWTWLRRSSSETSWCTKSRT